VALAGAGVIACWASAGTAPVTAAVEGARDPADFVRDYVTARARLEDGRGAPPDGEAANARAARLGAPRVLLLDGPFHLHPPPALLPVLAVAWLPWHAAARAWTALSLGALAWLAWSLTGLWATDRRRPRARHALLLFAALALWPPTLHSLEKGQWSIALAALLAAAARALERGRAGWAGALFGVAASLKATPLVLLPLLLARSRRAAAAMVGTLAALAALATAVEGAAPWRSFVVDAPRDVAVWATWLANTASLQGVLARLFAPSVFSRALVTAPAVSRVGFLVASAALVAAAALVGWRRGLAGARAPAATEPAPDDARAVALWTGAWLALPVLLNPLAWSHVVVMLLAPAVIALRDGGARTRAVTLLALAALSIPRQRLMAWAGPVRVAPGPGLVLGLHAAAALALYFALLAACAAPSISSMRARTFSSSA
jgi:hypothetical protein